MTNSSLLFYGQQEDSLKKIILNILSIKHPLGVSEIYSLVKKEYGLKITYQAVHKAVRQLWEDGCLEKERRAYIINLTWLEELSTSINHLEKSYVGSKKETNIIAIKDGSLVDKLEKERIVSHLEHLVPIFRQAFTKHNIFEKSEEEVLGYLLELQKKHEIIIFSSGGEVSGGAVLLKEEDTRKYRFTRWRIVHFACSNNSKEEERLRFIAEIEERVKREGEITKLHIGLAENERLYIPLFEKAGFKKEATLEDFYRPGEKAYLYAKKFS